MKKILYFLIFSLFYINVISQPLPTTILWEKTANTYTIKFSPNGEYLVTGGGTNSCYPFYCGQIKYWRVADSALVNTITHAGQLIGWTNDIAFSPDGSKIFTGHGSVYCAPNGGCSQDRTGQFTWTFPAGNNLLAQHNPIGIVEAVDYSPNGQLIATGRSYNNIGQILIYNSNNFSLYDSLEGHNISTNSVRFTPDGNTLVSGGHDGNVKMWDVASGNLIRTLHHGTYLNGGWDVQVAVSPNGQLIASCGQGYNPAVKVWRASDGVLLHTFLVSSNDGYTRVEFSPNNVYVVSGATVYESGIGWHGIIKFWRASDGAVIQEYIDQTGSPQAGGVRAIAFSNTGNNYFAYAISNKLRVAQTNLSLVTPTGISGTTTTPDKFTLEQNYPNPFNPSTTIKYNIPSKSHVKIEVIDVTGKLVSNLVNSEQNAGSYEITFNAASLASGLYYYRITTPQFTSVKKMLFLK